MTSVPIKLDPHKCPMVLCDEEDCIFNRTCANHVSAGDFRSEGGMRPKLSLRQGVVHCATKNAPVDREVEYEMVPKKEFTSYWCGDDGNDGFDAYFQGFLWKQLVEESETYEI